MLRAKYLVMAHMENNMHVWLSPTVSVLNFKLNKVKQQQVLFS